MNLSLTQEKLSQKITSANSWSDMVRSIEYDKRKELNMDEFKPAPRVTMFQKKREERIVDPVSMKYRDPEREKEYQNKKETMIKKKGELAKLEISSKFNIVNHQGPPRRIEVDPPNLLNHGHSRDYHILTNMRKTDHQLAPIIYDDNFVQDKTKRPPRELNFTAPNRREFDIVSNNYYADNETRQVQDKAKIREHVEDVYWLTHDYDPIKGQYFSVEKEENFKQQRALVASVQGLSQQFRLPPSVKYSEGNSYNIIQQTVSNEDNLKVSSKLSQGHISHANEIQKKQREAGIERLELEEKRSMNRPNFNRWKTELERGYNIVDNLPKEPYLPYPKRPMTVWTRLQESSAAPSNNASNVLTRSAGHTPYYQVEVNTSSTTKEVPLRPATTAANPPASSRSTTSRVPLLPLSLAEQPEPVTYKEVKGPPGLAIPMVRTGGLSNA